MKATYTLTIARKILLIFLTFAVVISIAALFVRNTITKRLQNISSLANHVEFNQSKPQYALLLLHQADDDFQEYLLRDSSKNNTNYKTKLSQAFKEIEVLLTDSSDIQHLNTNRIKLWHQKKLKLSVQLGMLKHDFDSLLTVYADFNKLADAKTVPIRSSTYNTFTNSENDIDTVKKVLKAEKKGLLRRITDAISNKSKPPLLVEIYHNNSTSFSDVTTEKIADRNKNLYSKKIQQLQQRNVKLLNMQKELITLNTRISNELERIINEVTQINYNIANELKGMAFKNYQETTELLNKLYQAALFFVLIFSALLIKYIIQLNKSELLLRNENERSIIMAQQKQDLLLHMSHEVRNPLTSIKGFLEIFGQTSLSQRQTEMLNSIKLSSDMLLQTLNDTLDAAKMENSEIKVYNEPFNPNFTLGEVIESMGYSAAKKQLSLQYNFKGNKEIIITGDSFRLKQIMVNLLSNAIKYTDEGGVTVNAEWLSPENRLQVDIIDTGAGIDPDQQANLFSKYYRTKSSKGKTGTGLGLFICKQLINLLGGKISVKSEPGVGSTFSFFISYQKSDVSLLKKAEDPLSLFNGISILAVDDNEFNLMLLKMMTSKWNVNFLQATNGGEALSIISEIPISVVLTDIKMPKMDGYELLTAIRSLNRPLNELPVIAVSGDTSGITKEVLGMGFSGIINKPFNSTELIAQLGKALKENKKHYNKII